MHHRIRLCTRSNQHRVGKIDNTIHQLQQMCPFSPLPKRLYVMKVVRLPRARLRSLGHNSDIAVAIATAAQRCY